MAPAISNDLVNSDVTKFVVDGHGVKALADMDLKALPTEYIQPLEERLDMSHVVSDVSIPVIDMSKWETDPKVAEAICNAAENWSFFQIINHGIPLEVLESVQDATYKFFGLSAEEKRKYLKENSPTNNVRLMTSFLPNVEKALEWKDYLSLFYVSEEEAETIWPPACKDQALEFIRTSEVVVRRLLDILTKGLNVKEIDENKESLLMGSRRINLNYYPRCPNPELTVGVGRHSDISTLTVLLQDNIGGLYVRKIDGEEWMHVQPITGALVINIGDALQIMSNGRYKSAEHRVVANESKDRISIPLFVNPKPTDVIAPWPEVLENGEEPIYKPILYSDYAKHFYRKAHDGKATLDLAKI